MPRIEIHFFHHFPDNANTCLPVTRHEFEHLETLMSEITDKLAILTAAQDVTDTKLDAFVVRHTDEVAVVTAELADLHAQIVALQALVDAGGTPADVAALDALIAREATHQARLDGLDPTSPAVLPES